MFSVCVVLVYRDLHEEHAVITKFLGKIISFPWNHPCILVSCWYVLLFCFKLNKEIHSLNQAKLSTKWIQLNSAKFVFPANCKKRRKDYFKWNSSSKKKYEPGLGSLNHIQPRCLEKLTIKLKQHIAAATKF